MSSLASKSANRSLAGSNVFASIVFALSMGVSHQALAVCSGANTAGDDTRVCNDANANIDLLAGNDKITVNVPAVMGSINGNAGNDLIIINGGTTGNIVGGNAVLSAADIDRIFVFGGTINGEVQTGAGSSVAGSGPFAYFSGGVINGSIEVRRGSQNAVVVIDGGTLNGEFEFQGANATQALPANPTVYFRSGTVTGELEANAENDTFIFDPVNSKSAADFQSIAAAAANGGAASLSTSNLNALLANASANTDANHKMIVNVDEISLGNGNDTLRFAGAVNNGDGTHNLELNNIAGDGLPELQGDIEVGGTPQAGAAGTADTIEVTQGSNLILGEIENFEILSITGGSTLTLSEDDDPYVFGSAAANTGTITVDGTSVLILSEGGTLETGHLELQAGAGQGPLSGLPSYYEDFATGGVLQVGPSTDTEISSLADDDDDDPGAPAETYSLTVKTGTATFVNGGTITMLNGVAGDSLAIVGNYESNNGNLAIDTSLGDSSSPTDTLSIDGMVLGTTTTVYVNNVNTGPGAFTGQGQSDGIEIASVTNGTFAPNAFQLAINADTGRREVVNGPFAYQLRVNDDEALLQSDVLDQVPAYTTAGAVAQRYASSGLDTLYKRVGEIRRGYNEQGQGTTDNGVIWVRGNYADFDVDPDKGYAFSQTNKSVLVGANANYKGEGAQFDLGVFGGYGAADADIDATIFGAASHSSVELDGFTFGIYGTYHETNVPAGTGFYADGVMKADFFDVEFDSSRGNSGDTQGDAFSASGEIGYGFSLGGGVVLQPQGQLSYTNTTVDSFTDTAPYSLAVSYQPGDSLIGRAGIQIQTTYESSTGTVTPYAIFNILSEFGGDYETRVNGVKFESDVSGTWYSAGGGVTAQLSNSVSIYGQSEYDFGDVEGWQGSGGVKVNW